MVGAVYQRRVLRASTLEIALRIKFPEIAIISASRPYLGLNLRRGLVEGLFPVQFSDSLALFYIIP